MPDPDAFTPADANRMSALFERRDDADLAPAELRRLVDAWQHAVYLDSLTLIPDGWAAPVLTEAMVRQALREAGDA